MEIKYITDVDFLPMEQYRYLYNEKYSRYTYEEELYQLVFGIIFHSNTDSIYNLIATLLKQQNSKILSKVKLKHWKNEMEVIISNLKRFEDKRYNVWVIIPIYMFLKNIHDTIKYFQIALSIIDECLLSDTTAELVDDEEFVYPLNDMKLFFWDFAVQKMIPNYEGDLFAKELIAYKDKIIKEGTLGVDLEALFDEMIRRGFGGNLEKSPNYDKNLFRKYYITSDKELDKTDLVVGDIEELSLNNATMQEQSVVVYYMLHSKQVDDDTITKVVNYMLGRPYNDKIKKLNKDSVAKYVRHNAKKLVDLKETTIKSVVKSMKEYDCEITGLLKEYE